MANNFKPWVDAPTAGQQVQSASVFASDAQRIAGFSAGDPASALRVNSALRQANIVIAGLMQFCDEIETLPTGLSLLSTVTQVKNAIKDSVDALHNITLTSAKDYTDTRETAINTAITNVQTQVTSNKNDITALIEQVDEHDAEISALSGGTLTLTTRVGTLETEMNTAQADIANNSSAIESLGEGNIKGTNVAELEASKNYAIQATTIPSVGGTLEGILVEAASVTDVERKLEKNFDGFYTEKTSLADNDLFAIQDSADTGTPKLNKRVKVSTLKTIKVNSASSADNATKVGNITVAKNETTGVITADTDYIIEKKQLLTSGEYFASSGHRVEVIDLALYALTPNDVLEIRYSFDDPYSEQTHRVRLSGYFSSESTYLYSFTNSIINTARVTFIWSTNKLELNCGTSHVFADMSTVADANITIWEVYRIIGG